MYIELALKCLGIPFVATIKALLQIINIEHQADE